MPHVSDHVVARDMTSSMSQSSLRADSIAEASFAACLSFSSSDAALTASLGRILESFALLVSTMGAM